MTTKISLKKVVTQHYATLYDNASRAASKRDWLIILGLPTLAAVCAWYFDLRVVAAGQILAGVSILGGFLFGLLTLVFQLRINATNDPRIPQGSNMARLLDELFANVAYTTVAAFATAAAALLPMSLGTTVPKTDGVLDQAWSVIVIALLVHFGLNLAMCVKRIVNAYSHYASR